LKTFLTQIGLALPLTPDPPVICFWEWIRWKNYEVPKNRDLKSVSAKKLIFFTQLFCTHYCTRLADHIHPTVRPRVPWSPNQLRCGVPHHGCSNRNGIDLKHLGSCLGRLLAASNRHIGLQSANYSPGRSGKAYGHVRLQEKMVLATRDSIYIFNLLYENSKLL
jgi:hypothetical protein